MGTREEKAAGAPELRVLSVFAGGPDVAKVREQNRLRRLRRLAFVLLPLVTWMYWRALAGRPVVLGLPRVSGDLAFWLPGIGLAFLFGLVLLLPLASSRSPHVRLRPEQIEVGFEDVVGIEAVREEVERTLDIFRTYRAFRDQLGGNPRRGILFEGPPGTGKTHLAKAMAREAGVPFFYVSATAFQSVWYGMTAWKIRSFFRALKRTSRKEGGAIGFIEEIDAIGAARGGLESASPPGARLSTSAIGAGGAGMVNELLIQLQSFETPPLGRLLLGSIVEGINLFLPQGRQIRRPKSPYHNILVIAATNRAGALDPALLRPGRFDRILSFDPPGRDGRRALIGYALARRAHAPEMEDLRRQDELSGLTFGYTPAMLQHLFDEALVWAVRDGRRELVSEDVHRARLSVEIGLPQPAAYEERERRLIATHEAGHAVAAHLCCPTRRLEVLTIVKRRAALGLLAHTETEERFTRSKSEIVGLLRVALAGMASEEIFFGETSTGVASDLAGATELAAQAVGTFGMMGSLISFEAMRPGPLGPGGVVDRVLSDPEGRERVEHLLTGEREAVQALLARNRHLVEALRDALLEREELVGDEITRVLVEHGAPPPVRAGAQVIRLDQ